MKIHKQFVDNFGGKTLVYKTEKNTWIKTTNKIKNPEKFIDEYSKFKTFYEFGPKIIDYSVESNEDVEVGMNNWPIFTFEMTNIEGDIFGNVYDEIDVSRRMFYYGKIYSEIIFSFYEYSKLQSNGMIYFHGDLKPGNLFIKGDEINFIDIDSFSWYKPTTVINLINRIQSDFSYWINLNLEDYVL